MSLLLSTRPQPGGGYGTILRVAVALGVPTAALQPMWLGADEYAPPAVDEAGYLPSAPAIPASVRQTFLADEDVPPVAGDVDPIVPMVVQPSQRVVYLSWGVDEEQVASAAAPLVEDEGYLPAVRQPLPPRLWLFSSDTAPSAALGPYLDDGVWLAPQPWTFAPLPTVWLATEEWVAPAAGSIVDDDAWVPSVVVQINSPRVLLVQPDEIPFPLTVDEEQPWLLQRPWPTVQPSPVAFADDDFKFTAPSPIVEDEGYLPVVRQPSTKLSLVVGGMAPAAAAPAAGTPDEYHHWAQLLPRPEPTTLFGPWSYAVAEDTGFVAIDDDLFPLLHITTVWKTSLLRQTLYDDDVVVQTGVATEEHWQAPGPWPLVPNRLVLVEPDEIPTAAAPLAIDEDSFVVSPTLPPLTVLFGPWSYAVSEDTGFLPPDDDLWLPRVVWPEAKPSFVWLDDEIICRPTALDEGQWFPPPLPPRAWARVVIEQPDEWPTPPPPLQVEDDCWIMGLTRLQLVRLVMPPALPPWFMEQHEQAADLKKPKKPPRDGQIRLHVSRDGTVSVWYT